ncbi:IS66 family insertion sequence element accessory protein TnpB [Myxococcus xanthus]|uniref:Transposase n=1 Tax=Myxococcus xanthus TaxID=34 RepID=A0A7Y4IR16_MYXXA|nr:IS66 family insertion sequence element accessory protein TnpB [Myxococcus xanthus]NOJ83721.1 hypothetical protein [Myxococcus xanthus]NOJ84854.1 hypothetical protein [Myxococcus xanthus]
MLIRPRATAGGLVAIEPVDFRRGVDGLVRQCRAALAEAFFGGAVFVFRNR